MLSASTTRDKWEKVDTICSHESLNRSRDQAQGATRPARTFLRVADLATHHHHRHAVEHALSRLAASDAPIVRARKGLYYRGVTSRFGKTRPRLMEVALEVTRGTGAGPAGWSALRALGLTTQVPSVDEVALVGAAPTGIDGVRFHVRRNPDRLHLTFDEIAALEAIRAWPTHDEGDAEALEDAVRGLVSAGRIRPERLVKAADRETPRPEAGFAASPARASGGEVCSTMREIYAAGRELVWSFPTLEQRVSEIEAVAAHL